MSYAYKVKQKYSYADYLKWNSDERWELISGVAFNMSPAPAPEHQEISGNIFYQIKKYLSGRKCKIYAAPFDVRFSETANLSDSAVDTVLQPDISVICDTSKIDHRGCNGAPDLVIEILSPYTSDRDMRDKFFVYEKHGVKEYWIVDPANKTVHQYELLDTGKYSSVLLHFKGDMIESRALSGLNLITDDLFQQ